MPYFAQEARLAQSSQFYKQFEIAGGRKREYVDVIRQVGVPPHGGGGIGLEPRTCCCVVSGIAERPSRCLLLEDPAKADAVEE